MAVATADSSKGYIQEMAIPLTLITGGKSVRMQSFNDCRMAVSYSTMNQIWSGLTNPMARPDHWRGHQLCD